MSKAAEALRAIKGGTDTGKATALPSIPNVPRTDDARVNQFLSAIKQVIETREGERGDSLDTSVTWRSLIEKGFATTDGSSGSGGVSPSWNNNGGTGIGDVTGKPYAGVPPAPTGFEGDGAFANIILSWDDPPYSNHSYTEVWRSSANNLGTAKLIGMAAGSVYVDNVGGQAKYYYWIRFVSTTGVKGPYNGTNGLLAETSPDPGFLLDLLTGQLHNSHLNKELSTRVDLIDGPATMTNSIAWHLLQEATARQAAITVESEARQTADSSIATQVTTLTAAVNQNAAAIQTEATTRANADSAEATARQTLAAKVDVIEGDLATTVAAINTEATTRATQDSALASQITTVSAAASKTRTYSQASAPTSGMVTGDLWFDTDDKNKAYRYNGTTWVITDDARIAANAADIITEATARANGDSANATLINQVQARLDTGDYAAVKTESSTTASTVNGIQAKYSVKVDVNGYVSGFGLISSANNSTPYSQFIFKADQFGFGAPGLNSAYPFVIQATATTINGVSVPAGVYIDAAYIKNGSITNAKIGNAAIDSAKIASVDAGTITVGTLSADRIGANSITGAKIAANTITADRIDSRGLSIKDASGNIILAAGTALSTSNISGLGSLATQNSVAYSSVTGTKPPTDADNTASNIAAGISGQGSFATLNQITAANISTYIASLAVDTLYIKGNAVTTATSFTTTGDISYIGASPVTVVSGTVTVSGYQPVLVNLSSWVGGAAANGSPNTVAENVVATVYIGANSKTIVPSLTAIPACLTCSSGSALFTGLSAGTYTISVKYAVSSGGQVLVRNPTVVVLETKR